MLKFRFTAAAFAAAVLLAGIPAFAQSSYAPANKPVAAPISAAHQQAQLANDPARCGLEVSRASDNIGLRIQQPIPGAETRLSAIADLQAAADAAAAGDDAACWHWYDRAQQVVR